MHKTLFAALLVAAPAVAVAGPFTITGPDCPSPTTWSASGLTPSSNVTIVSGSGTGADVVLAGGCLVTTGLSGSIVRSTMTADASGNLNLAPNLANAACGMYMQIVDQGTCTVSDVAQMPTQNLFYTGSYRVGTGANWTLAPATYTCREACAANFGGIESDYHCSTLTGKVTTSAKTTGYAIPSCPIYNDGYKVGVTYVPGSYSAWTQDNCTVNDTNYCWSY